MTQRPRSYDYSYDGSRSRVRAAGASGWALRRRRGRAPGPARPSLGPGSGAAGQAQSKAVLATASWTATERAPHQRLAQPEDAAARTAGGARKARSRTRSRTKPCAAVFQRPTICSVRLVCRAAAPFGFAKTAGDCGGSQARASGLELQRFWRDGLTGHREARTRQWSALGERARARRCVHACKPLPAVARHSAAASASRSVAGQGEEHRSYNL